MPHREKPDRTTLRQVPHGNRAQGTAQIVPASQKAGITEMKNASLTEMLLQSRATCPTLHELRIRYPEALEVSVAAMLTFQPPACSSPAPYEDLLNFLNRVRKDQGLGPRPVFNCRRSPVLAKAARTPNWLPMRIAMDHRPAVKRHPMKRHPLIPSCHADNARRPRPGPSMIARPAVFTPHARTLPPCLHNRSTPRDVDPKPHDHQRRIRRATGLAPAGSTANQWMGLLPPPAYRSATPSTLKQGTSERGKRKSVVNPHAENQAMRKRAFRMLAFRCAFPVPALESLCLVFSR